jgi:hypothetical protein
MMANVLQIVQKVGEVEQSNFQQKPNSDLLIIQGVGRECRHTECSSTFAYTSVHTFNPLSIYARDHFAKLSLRRFFHLGTAWRALTPMDRNTLVSEFPGSCAAFVTKTVENANISSIRLYSHGTSVYIFNPLCLYATRPLRKDVIPKILSS